MPDFQPEIFYPTLVIVGLVAGALGGLLGVGGSVIMIPVLVIFLNVEHHLSQAAAMIVNVVVALAALWQHHRADSVRWDVMRGMLPFALIFIVVGVLLSNQSDGALLQRIFGVFLLYVITTNVLKLLDRSAEPKKHEQRTSLPIVGGVGSLMGFVAGLLGIGGGGLAVPLLQRICQLPLRQCIGTSSAVMCITAVVGAILKNATIHTIDAGDTPLRAIDSVIIAACLTPTAILGSFYGAQLTHALPLRWVRVAFILLMMWVAAELLGLVQHAS